MQDIHVRFGTSPRAQSDLGFAIDLARRLRGRLFVWTESDSAARGLLERAGVADSAAREQAHVRDRVGLRAGLAEAGLAPVFCQGDPSHAVHDPRSIVVGDRDAVRRPAFAAVISKGEASLGARGASEICLPFANGASALDAAALAIPLASALGAPLLLYHTTWRKEGLPPEAPAERHMTAEAAAVRDAIIEMAEDEAVAHRTVVETATAIAEGTVRAALNQGCALIALARGRHVGRGSYVDQVLSRSVIPVLVAGRSKA